MLSLRVLPVLCRVCSHRTLVTFRGFFLDTNKQVPTTVSSKLTPSVPCLRRGWYGEEACYGRSGLAYGTPSLVYCVLRSAHLSITVVGQICIPEVANGLTLLAGSLGDTYL